MITALILRSLALVGVCSLATASLLARAETSGAPVSVVELFTSQGCSSCPPADKLLQELSKRPDIIALSFPVSYWDYLGWKDTLARPENSRRQRQYAAARGDGQVYTPQAIVNGVVDCVGSDVAAIEAAVQTSARTLSAEAVTISARSDNGRLLVDVGRAPDGARHRSGKVWVATVARSATIDIGRGENAGRRVTYTNVVEKLTEAGDWHGEPATYTVPLASVAKEGDSMVVFLQVGGFGPIVGAVRIEG